MKIIKASYEIEPIDGIELLKKIEKAGKTCYKSEHTIVEEPLAKSARKFIKMIIKNGHESVLEHEKVTVRVICDRGVSHEIVRHRIASYSQESTRYCNYSKSKDKQVKVIDIRRHIDGYIREKGGSHSLIGVAIQTWCEAIEKAEESYNHLIDIGLPPELARSVLPNSLKTEIVITYNLRQWRHFFKLRAQNKRAHPQLREITIPMLKEFKEIIPVVFDDIKDEW